MVEAELELLQLQEKAVPLLEALLRGEAKNRFGVPYRDLGLPLRCALEVASRLGPVAKPLERDLLRELEAGNFVAAMALGELGSLEEPSVRELAVALGDGHSDLAFEAAAALLKCGSSKHSAVVSVVSSSERAALVLARAEALLARKGTSIG